MLTDMQVDRIVDNIIATGGATFNASGLFSYLKGFQVGIAGVGRKNDLMRYYEGEGLKAAIARDIRDFEAHKSILLEEGFDFGAWMHKGTLYLDVTRHYSDGILALKRAREMKEQAIWDWETMSEISAIGPSVPAEVLS